MRLPYCLWAHQLARWCSAPFSLAARQPSQPWVSSKAPSGCLSAILQCDSWHSPMSKPSTWQWCIDRWQEVPAGYGRVVQAGIAEVQLLSLPAGVLAMSDQALLFHGGPEHQASSAEASDRQPGRSARECPPRQPATGACLTGNL